jgi:hypothetical protein
MTFVVPRNIGHRASAAEARTLFVERVNELRAVAARVLTGAVAEKALARIDKTIALLEKSKPPRTEG